MKLRFSFAPRHALAVLMAVGATLALGGGCSRQSEGERCSTDNGDEDCDGSLICTPAADLQAQDGIDRCCPEDGGTGACTPRGASAGTGGTGLGGGGNEGGAAGSPSTEGGLNTPCTSNTQCSTPLICSSGTCKNPPTCNYNSECIAPFACISGKCLPECREDRDCASPLVCVDFSCVAQ